jgi:hypothetical protein
MISTIKYINNSLKYGHGTSQLWYDVEGPDPKGLSIFLVSAQSSRSIGNANSCPPDLELGSVH